MNRRFIASGLVVLCATLLMFGWATTQTTSGGAVGVDRQQTMLVSSAEVNSEAEKAYRQAMHEAQGKAQLNRNQGQVTRVRSIANRLIAATGAFRRDAPGWRWEVNVISSKELNAWCMPGGKMAVYTGLIEQLRLSDDELAAVMGHEIAHALREHGREAMSKAYATQMAQQGVGALLGLGQDSMALADSVVEYGMTLPNSRDNENEADLIGLELSARAGYDPQAAISLWQKMSSNNAGAPPEFMSTHPLSSSRISALQNAIPKVMPLYQQAKAAR